MNQKLQETVFYGSIKENAAAFDGLAVRYNKLSTDKDSIGYQVIDAGGKGNNNTSIWFVTWGDLHTHLIYPKGTKAGLNHIDKGVVTAKAPDGNGDFEAFKALVIESGASSYMYNQNVYTCKAPANQPVSVALAICQDVLGGKGAWRVHGGGFAGTIQAFVPNDLLDTYKSTLESIFGEGACYVLCEEDFRQQG